MSNKSQVSDLQNLPNLLLCTVYLAVRSVEIISDCKDAQLNC